MISPQIKFKKKWLDNKGVSEIIGTILMLAITVVLFSSIMVFVTNMPTPISRPNADFLSSVTYNTTTNSGIVTLTHNGGEALNDYETQLLVIVDGDVRLTPRTIAAGGLGATWGIGQKWTCWISSLAATSTLEIMVIDLHSNSQIWDGKINAGAGNNAPVILQRWTDSDPNTLTADTIVEGNSYFWLYVRITDLDNDIQSVTVDASSIGASSSKTYDTLNAGVWGYNFTTPITQASLFDGKPLFIIANDTANHWTNATFLLTVSASERGPQGEKGDKGDTGSTSGSDINPSGLPSYLKFYDSESGYVLLGANTSVSPPVLPNLTDARNLFTQGEYVFIRVGSYKLQNIFALNEMYLMNRLTGLKVYPCSGGLSNITPFYRVAEAGAVNVYEAKFPTTNLPSSQSDLLGGYDVVMNLQSTVTGVTTLINFHAVGTLIVSPPTGSITLPTLTIHKTNPLNVTDVASTLFGGDKDHPFDIANPAECTIWVNMTFLDGEGGSTLNIDNVRIADLRSRIVVTGVPPTSDNLMSQKWGDLNKSYVFSIDLRLKNGYNFVPGVASYTLTLSKIFDANEGVYTFSDNIWIESSVALKNFVVSSFGYGFTETTSNFAHYDLLFQIENNKFFTTRILDSIDASPGTRGDLLVYNVIYFDADGDGDRDVIASMKYDTTYMLGVYLNRINEFGRWELRSNIPSPDGSKIISLASGDVNNDEIDEFVVATANSHVYYYSNGQIVPPVLLVNAYFLEMKLLDVTNDSRADLIGMGNITPAVVTRGAAGCKIYMYDLDGGSAARIRPVNDVDNIMDFEMSDINGDGRPDLATLRAYSNRVGPTWHYYSYVDWIRNDASANAKASTSSISTAVGTQTGGVSDVLSASGGTVGAGIEQLTESSGALSSVWTLNPLPATSKTPSIYVWAKINSVNAENFYFYYAVGTGPFSFMFMVPSSQTSSYKNFTFPLPGTLGGSILKIKVTDSTTDAGSDSTIYIDTVGIASNSGIAFTASTNIFSEDTIAGTTPYLALGVGNMNGDTTMDFVIAKDGIFLIYNGATKALLYTSSGAAATNLRATGDTFVVTDVNGDGLADVIGIGVYMTFNCVVYEWINIASGTNFYGIQVKNLYESLGHDASDVQCLRVENPNG